MENEVVTNPLTNPTFAQASQIAANNDPAALAREFGTEVERLQTAQNVTASVETPSPAQNISVAPQTSTNVADKQGTTANADQPAATGKPEGATQDKPATKKEYTVHDAKAEYLLRWRRNQQTQEVNIPGLAHDLRKDGYNDPKVTQAVMGQLSSENQAKLAATLELPDTYPAMNIRVETAKTAVNAINCGVQNFPAKLGNGLVDTAKALTFQLKPESEGKGPTYVNEQGVIMFQPEKSSESREAGAFFKEHCEYRNPVAEEAAHAPQAVVGTLGLFRKAPTVRAKGRVGGAVFEDVNQTERFGARSELGPRANEPTILGERVAKKQAKQPEKEFPNGTQSTAHAEIGVVQQAWEAGKTQGQHMTMEVVGKDVCGFCKGDIAAAAEKSGLRSLKVIAKNFYGDGKFGNTKTYFWEPGMKSLKEVPNP